MGGDRSLHRRYTNLEIVSLVETYFELACRTTFRSLFTNRRYDSFIKWKNDVGRHLDTDSRTRFYYCIEIEENGIAECKHCGSILDISRFSFAGYNRGFTKYCESCTTGRKWVDYIDQEAKGRKISSAKKKFYQTEAGKRAARVIGTKNSAILKEFHKTDEGRKAREKSAIRNSKIMKAKILSGEFTPNSNNRNTHWESSFKGKKFRSSWECIYQYWDQDSEYETLRIPYSHNGTDHIYIIDFVNHRTREVIEVKPKDLLTEARMKSKIRGAERWCQAHGYTFKIVDEVYLRQLGRPASLNEFDDKTIQKIENFFNEKTKN